MCIRILIFFLIAIVGLSTPQAAIAQQEAPDSDDPCENFNWLLGTWNSYSPWGERTDPTGGTLIFTMGAGGTVEGRIGALNSYMEENGYTAGMLVYRGFREVRAYGPTGTTSQQAFDGQFLQVADGVSQWREDTVGVRQNGELYMSPPAIAHLSGHGPFRKAARSQVSGLCDPSAPLEASADPSSLIDAVFGDSDYDPIEPWLSLLESSPATSPILLYPRDLPPDDCLNVHSVIDEEPNAYTRQPVETKLANLTDLANTLKAGGLDPDARRELERQFIRLHGEMETELYGLSAARMLETSPRLRDSYDARMERIEASLDHQLIDDIRGNSTITAQAPASYDDAEAEEACRRFLSAEPLLVNPFPDLPDDDDMCMDVHSVLNEESNPYQRQDTATMLANLEGFSRQLSTLEPGDDGYAGAERAYLQYLERLRAEQIAYIRLSLEVNDPQEASRYRERANEIGDGLLSAPRDLLPDSANTGEASSPETGTETQGQEQSAESTFKERIEAIFGPEDALPEIDYGEHTLRDQIEQWFLRNEGLIDSIEFDEEGQFIRVNYNEEGIRAGCSDATDE